MQNCMLVRKNCITNCYLIFFIYDHFKNTNMNNSEYPEVTDEDRLGSKGMRIVQDIVEDSLDWVFRSQITRDLGIDAHIEIITKKNEATGKIIAVQIKCGESFFSESNEDGYVFRPILIPGLFNSQVDLLQNISYKDEKLNSVRKELSSC